MNGSERTGEVDSLLFRRMLPGRKPGRATSSRVAGAIEQS
jgi:hypothetical protein